MHCVKRIKCCGWTDEVTFLYHPGSLLPLSSMMAFDDETLGNKAHRMRASSPHTSSIRYKRSSLNLRAVGRHRFGLLTYH